MSIGVSCLWRFREVEPLTRRVVKEQTVKNLFTVYGLTQFASAPNGAYTAPIYLILESTYTTSTGTINIGDGLVTVNARVDQTGDTQLILGVGTANQETVTFTGVTGSGPYTYTLSGTCTKSHTNTDPICRQISTNDTMTNVAGEVQYDSVNFANQRLPSPGGYSPGSGQWTMQWYYPAASANAYIIICGMSENITVGAGNLHNHFVLGFDHRSSSNDLEIDATLTLVNN